MGSVQVRTTREHKCKMHEETNTAASLLNAPLAGHINADVA